MKPAIARLEFEVPADETEANRGQTTPVSERTPELDPDPWDDLLFAALEANTAPTPVQNEEASTSGTQPQTPHPYALRSGGPVDEEPWVL